MDILEISVRRSVLTDLIFCFRKAKIKYNKQSKLYIIDVSKVENIEEQERLGVEDKKRCTTLTHVFSVVTLSLLFSC